MSEPNPFLFPSILQEVFLCLAVKELKLCRLVSRDWEVEAYRAMRGRTQISISNYMQVKNYVHLEEARKDFCDAFVLNSNINVDTPLTSKLFTEFGRHIKSLSLQKSKWKDAQLTTLLFDKLPNLERLAVDCVIPKPSENGRYLYLEDSKGTRRILPRLKYLRLETSAWESMEISPSNIIKAFLNDVFTIAPNIEKIATNKPETNYHPLEFLFPLDVAHIATFINGEVVDALDELSGLGFESQTRRVLFDSLVTVDVRPPKLNKLKEIDIHMILRDEHIRKLTAKDYALETLEIIITQSVVLANLHTLLQNVSPTLRNLNLRYLRRSSCNQTFPSAVHMKNLRSLTLTGFRASLSFLRHFENLEVLVIIKIPSLATAFPPNGIELEFTTPLQKLHTLEIYEEEIMSPSSVRRSLISVSFPRIFPNLRRLRMDHLCNSSLRAIYHALPNLTELIAKNGKFTDAGITGINLECRIVPYRTIRIVTVSKNKQLPKKGKTAPPKPEILCIGALKDLTVLDLHSKEMSDFSITAGVTKCKKLKQLTLMSYKLTDASIRKLVDELNLEYLKTEYCYQLTKDVVDYVNEKMGGMEVLINEYEGPMNAEKMWKFLKRNNNMQVPIMRMTKKQIENTKKSLRTKEPQPSTSAGAGPSSSRR